MQKSNVDFYPVLLLSILADTLLRLHTGYWARAGLLALPASPSTSNKLRCTLSRP